MTIKTVSFNSFISGKKLAVLGAVHGNEKAGTIGINKVISEIESEKIEILKGKVTFVPITNVKAYDANQRFIDRDLNRLLYPKESPQVNEDYVGNIICPILDDTDVLLDIHSYQAKGGAFAFIGTTNNDELEYCHNLGVTDFVYGWSDAFGGSDEQKDPRESMGTTEYARTKGAIGVTVECGQHLNENNPQIAYETIINALCYLGIIDKKHQIVKNDKFTYVKMKDVFYQKKAGSLIDGLKHYSYFEEGQVIANYDDGSQVKAPYDGYVILPCQKEVGKSWFYFGVATDKPLSANS